MRYNWPTSFVKFWLQKLRSLIEQKAVPLEQKLLKKMATIDQMKQVLKEREQHADQARKEVEKLNMDVATFTQRSETSARQCAALYQTEALQQEKSRLQPQHQEEQWLCRKLIEEVRELGKHRQIHVQTIQVQEQLSANTADLTQRLQEAGDRNLEWVKKEEDYTFSVELLEAGNKRREEELDALQKIAEAELPREKGNWVRVSRAAYDGWDMKMSRLREKDDRAAQVIEQMRQDNKQLRHAAESNLQIEACG